AAGGDRAGRGHVAGTEVELVDGDVVGDGDAGAVVEGKRAGAAADVAAAQRPGGTGGADLEGAGIDGGGAGVGGVGVEDDGAAAPRGGAGHEVVGAGESGVVLERSAAAAEPVGRSARRDRAGVGHGAAGEHA